MNMASPLRFDDQVVIITGAGNGLGRSHAHLFASRGAKVVVNDLGSSPTGDGGSQNAADKVVEEIREAGGIAVANYDSVEFGDKIVATAIEHFGRIDVVVNNAGILRDKSFHKLTDADWDIIFKVHVLGAFKVTHAAWPYFREQQYGRVINTASAAGIYGNFGQSNYGAAKLALAGFTNTLALEGKKRNIHVNTIAPLAASRLTKGIVPDAMFDALKPELVSPLVAWLTHKDCDETGGLFEVGGGMFAKLRWERAAGKIFRLGRDITPDDVAANWNDVTSFETSEHPADITASMGPVVDNINAGISKGGNSFIDVDLALGAKIPTFQTSYEQKDVSLYALGIGAGSHGEADLQMVYENHGSGFRVIPTYSVAPVIKGIIDYAMKTGTLAPGLNFGLDRLLHGEQTTEILLPMPAKGTLTHKSKVTDIFDKGKGAIVVIKTSSYDEDRNEIVRNTLKAFIRGAGGWGGDRGPKSGGNEAPDRAPDVVTEQATSDSQALLYRLSGDANPLHVDPGFAKAFGFDKPILHGLCTYGFGVRHVVDAFAGGDPRLLKHIHVRFADSVLPGETITTEMWKESDTRIVFTCKVAERDSAVITHAAVELYTEIPTKPEPVVAQAVVAEAAPAAPGADAIFGAIGSHVVAHPELNKIGKVFQFTLSGPDSLWSLDLKNGGGVSAGAASSPDCTLEMSNDDFLAMSSGEVDAMKLYMSGKLQISGDLMASQKLGFLKDIEAPAPSAVAPAPAAKPAAGPKSVGAFIGIGVYIERNAELVSKIGKVFCFKLSEPESAWTIDLKNGDGSVTKGESKADCTLSLSEANFGAMMTGEVDAMKLYMDGNLKIDGDLMASQKLTFLQKIDPDEIKDEVAKRLANPGAVAAAAPVVAEAIAPKVFAALSSKVAGGIGKTGIVQFTITGPDAAYNVDLATGTVNEGSIDNAVATFIITDDSLGALAADTSPRDLFQRGQLRIEGNFALAHDITFLNGLA
jgi:(3R)-3-hydroxyacyl-CoA dehydrogenase / 3a,7a,12a-trihydroxy-5b-cholest-24-enoyl-CoA hydratase / enoyl-CoA hydratase 2